MSLPTTRPDLLATSALDLLPEEVLLVTRSGRVVGANRAARRALPQLETASNQTLALAELCAQDELRLARWLRDWSRSPKMTPGFLEFSGAGGRHARIEVDAGGLRLPGLPQLVLIRFRREALFVRRILQLNARIEALNSELAQDRGSRLRLRLAQHGLPTPHRRLRDLTTRDRLTGLGNRRRFDTALAEGWQRGLRQQQWLALLLVDVDHFRHYNARYGAAAGDRCLKQIAQATATAVRGGSDLAARIRGGMFALLLPDTRLHAASLVAERLLATVRGLGLAHLGLSGSGALTISAGVAALQPNLAEPAEHLLEAAEHGLQRAKQSGRNRVCRALPRLLRRSAAAARPPVSTAAEPPLPHP